MLNEKEHQLSALLTHVGKEKKSKFYLFPELCKGCGLCIAKCPQKTLVFSHELGIYGTPVPFPGEDGSKCTACGICQMFCPDCAISIEK